MKFKANIKNGKLLFIDYDRFKDWLSFQKDSAVDITIKKPFNKRSIDQNSRYWKVYCKQLGDYLGYEPDEIHVIFKYFILKPHFDLQSTTELSKMQFSEYCERIEIWCNNEHEFNFELND